MLYEMEDDDPGDSVLGGLGFLRQRFIFFYTWSRNDLRDILTRRGGDPAPDATRFALIRAIVTAEHDAGFWHYEDHDKKEIVISATPPSPSSPLVTHPGWVPHDFLGRAWNRARRAVAVHNASDPGWRLRLIGVTAKQCRDEYKRETLITYAA